MWVTAASSRIHYCISYGSLMFCLLSCCIHEWNMSRYGQPREFRINSRIFTLHVTSLILLVEYFIPNLWLIFNSCILFEFSQLYKIYHPSFKKKKKIFRAGNSIVHMDVDDYIYFNLKWLGVTGSRSFIYTQTTCISKLSK